LDEISGRYLPDSGYVVTGRSGYDKDVGSGFQVDKLVENAKSRLTGNKEVKATFLTNGWNP
jgi:hypothetical protein